MTGGSAKTGESILSQMASCINESVGQNEKNDTNNENDLPSFLKSYTLIYVNGWMDGS